MLLPDKDDVVNGFNCRNYNIVVVHSGQGFYNFRIFEYRRCFCAHWPEFFDSNLNQQPNSFDPFCNGINLLFFSFYPFSGIVIHKKSEVVFTMYRLWLTIFWTFCKDFTEILTVYDAQIPCNNVASRTLT